LNDGFLELWLTALGTLLVYTYDRNPSSRLLWQLWRGQFDRLYLGPRPPPDVRFTPPYLPIGCAAIKKPTCAP
jgi:hypothetical protein